MISPFIFSFAGSKTSEIVYAVARSSALNKDVPAYLLTGLIAGLSIQAIVALQQKMAGQAQVGGWFGHQNLLGMASHFIVYPAFAAFLGGYYVRRTALCVGAGFIVAWAGGSRATIGLMGIGLVLTILLSCWRRSSSRKMAVAGLGLLCIIAAVPIFYGAVERRSEEVRAASSEERQRMRAAASMVVADHPLGVGANRFVAVANVGGYYARAGVAWTSNAALVHNTYYLVAAEMSVLGLAALIGMMVAIFSLAWDNLKRAPPGFGYEYALGAAVTVLAVAAHSYYEWITMYYVVHVLFAMAVGVMVALRASLTKKTAAPRFNRQEPFEKPLTFPAA